MTLSKLIANKRAVIAEKMRTRSANVSELAQLREVAELTTEQEARIAELRSANEALDTEVGELTRAVAELEAEQAADEAADAVARVSIALPTATRAERPAAVVTNEARTYSRETDPYGGQFARDIAVSFMYGDTEARERLSRHMAEERVERGGLLERAGTTGNYAGLTVPQYLVDLVAPNAKAGRPFADACRRNPLPSEGMTVEISRITTGSSAAIQATQNSAVSSTDIDDTVLSIPVQTNAGQQDVSRQVIERTTGGEQIILEDLFRAYNTNLDSTLINQATTGLSAAATSVAYTDTTPTATELYPKLFQAASEVETALLDMDAADCFVVMHSRRWFWLNSNLSTAWPLVAQPGVPAQTGGVNDGTPYGSGFRGRLVNGMPVVVDNNIPTNKGAGTNEDEVYVVAQSECHLWEDPQAPMFIRAEQTNVGSLGVKFVVYGYFAYTFGRRPHARVIGGTGLVAPTFA